MRDAVAMREWVASQTWYQSMQLTGGIEIRGTTDSSQRLPLLDAIGARGKRVLDVGCNSGAYCLWAARAGAAQVVGVDIDERRLAQARRIAEYEGAAIEYRCASAIGDHGQHDLVLAFAVLTEVRDVIGAVEAVAGAVAPGGTLILELALAEHALDLRRTKRGWMLAPSFEVLRQLLGPDFEAAAAGDGLRYTTVLARRGAA